MHMISRIDQLRLLFSERSDYTETFKLLVKRNRVRRTVLTDTVFFWLMAVPVSHRVRDKPSPIQLLMLHLSEALDLVNDQYVLISCNFSFFHCIECPFSLRVDFACIGIKRHRVILVSSEDMYFDGLNLCDIRK